MQESKRKLINSEAYGSRCSVDLKDHRLEQSEERTFQAHDQISRRRKLVYMTKF